MDISQNIIQQKGSQRENKESVISFISYCIKKKSIETRKWDPKLPKVRGVERIDYKEARTVFWDVWNSLCINYGEGYTGVHFAKKHSTVFL